MSRGSRKGGRFEREMAVLFSEWWSRGIEGKARDDIFWRTGGSGARATVRHRAGKQTTNQHGDLAAVDPIGIPFTRAVTVSLKRGYNSQPLADLLDQPPNVNGVWVKWIREATAIAGAAGTRYWVVVAKRDRREALVVAPRLMCREIFLGSYDAQIRTAAGVVSVVRLSWFLKLDPNKFLYE